MLTRIEIDGFKSFTNFSMDFSPLTLIAGLNASGKSNLFDALHLLSLLAEFDLNTAFDKVQRGRNLELFTQYADGRFAEEMRFAVEVELGSSLTPFLPDKLRYELALRLTTRQEVSAIRIDHESLAPLGVDPRLFAESFLDNWLGQAVNEHFREFPVAFFSVRDYASLVISGKSVEGTEKKWRTTATTRSEPHSKTMVAWATTQHNQSFLMVIGDELRSWKLLHLDPQKLPAATPAQAFGLPGTLNAAADNLAGVFYRLSKTDPYLLTRIAQRLASLVPGIKEFKVINNEYGGVYEVWVHTTAGQRFPLRLLSEGTLRMLALCTLAFDDQQHSVLGLEEPENGVHPGLLPRVAELLRDLSTNEPPEEGEAPWPLRQVIVNTHSPGLIKACLAAVAGQEAGKSGLTVWFSQLVSRPVEEAGERVMRRVTDMLPVVLPHGEANPSAAKLEELDPARKRLALYQLIRFLESSDSDSLLDSLGLATPNASATA